MIANMIAQIKNAQAVNKESVKIPYSNLNYEFGRLLAENGYVRSAEKKGRGLNRYVEIGLKYKDGNGVIEQIKLVSKPSRRVYIKAKEVRPYRSGVGIRVISTPKGLKTDTEARRLHLGGELMCNIW